MPPEHRSPTAHAGGQSAGAGHGGAMDVGGEVPHLHMHRVVRVVDVHGHLGEGLGQPSADLLGELNGVEGEGLVGALGFDLKTLGHAELVSEIRKYRGIDGVGGLFAGAAAAHGGDAEHRGAGLPGAVQIAAVALRLHIDGGLLEVDAEVAVGLHPATDVALEAVFKGAAILSLEDDLAQL